MEVEKVKGKGKQKITMERIENKSKRCVTFSKRRKGLFKKAREVSSMCGAQVGVLTFSSAGKLFVSPDSEPAIRRFIHDNNNNHMGVDDNNGDNPCAKNNENGPCGSQNNGRNRGGFWWEQSIEGLGLAELQGFKTALEGLRDQVAFKIDYHMINNSGVNIKHSNNINDMGTSMMTAGEVQDFDFGFGFVDGIFDNTCHNCVADDQPSFGDSSNNNNNNNNGHGCTSEIDPLLDILLNDYC